MAKTIGKCPHCKQNITVTLDDALLNGDDELQEGEMSYPTQCPKCRKWFYTEVYCTVDLKIGAPKEDPKTLVITEDIFNEIFKKQ